MSSSGPQSTSTSGPPSWFQDYARTALERGGQLAQQGYTPYQGQRVANMSPLQNQALGGLGALAGGTQSLFSAENSLNRTLNGGYQNPFEDQVVGRVTSDVTDAFNRATAGTRSAYNTPGNFGSARQGLAHDTNETNLARGLGDAIGGIRSGNFENERNRQMQAAGMAPSLLGSVINSGSQLLQAGGIPRGYEQQLLDSLYGDFTDQRDHGWNQLSRFAGLLHGTPTGTTQTTQQGYDPVSQGLGLMIAANSKGGNG